MTKASGCHTPAPLNATVSAQMQRMPRSSSGPEMLIRRELHSRGLRFRVNHPRLPGRPDIAFTAARIAVFIDGCFWHSCPDHSVPPKNNRDWWRSKLERNVERDREKDPAENWAGQCCMCGSTRSLSKQQMRLNGCGVPYATGVASRPRHLTCEILGDVYNGLVR